MQTVFLPERRKGLLIQIGVTLLLVAGCALLVISAFQQNAGANFILLLLASLFLLAPLVLVSYRSYALSQAMYALERDGLHLRWGLRAEDIPLPEIEWVRPAAELGFRLHLPWLHWPGAILGTRMVEGLGEVEFMASDEHALLLVATTGKVYAISPLETGRFMRVFQNTIELGSLAPIQPFSAMPQSFMQGVWADRAARILMMIGFVSTLALLAVVTLRIPTLSYVSLGFDPQGNPLAPASPDRLMLLPILGAFAFILDLVGGLFFFRRQSWRSTSYLLWASGIVFPLLLIAATFQLK